MDAKRRGGTEGGAGESGPMVDDILDAYPDEIRGLAERVRSLIRDTVPEAQEVVKWGNPVFEYRGMGFCYVQAQRGYLRFGFQQGAKLDDPAGLLEGSGKAMRHVKLRSEEDLRPVFTDWLCQSIAIIAGTGSVE